MSEPPNEPEVRDSKRKQVRDRYDDETVRVMAELVPRLKAAADAAGAVLHVNFDVNAAGASIVIEMGKRGCQ